MGSYLYLIINVSAILIPFIFSFHKKLNFHYHFKSFLVGFLFMFPLFIVWDIYFTKMGVWGFNSDYLMGFSLFNLPIEELKEMMHQAALELDFERAAFLRDKIIDMESKN